VLRVLSEENTESEERGAEGEPAPWRLTSEEISCLDDLGVDLEDNYNRNLERLMELLFSQRLVLQRSTNTRHWPKLDLVNSIIKKVQNFLWTRVTAGLFARGDHVVRDLYEMFYRKLVLRDRSLPRPWVFTTNYDIFNETAMDRLGIPYANGFNGVVERRFNPASFRYALAEQLDVGNRRWAVIDAFVYLCKLHGSVSWMEDDHGLFPIREKWPADDASKIMIYPTPAKHQGEDRQRSGRVAELPMNVVAAELTSLQSQVRNAEARQANVSRSSALIRDDLYPDQRYRHGCPSGSRGTRPVHRQSVRQQRT
jgi:hypothetical protein